MPKPLVRLYSRSRLIIKTLTEAFEEFELPVEVNHGPRPVTCSFVVTNSDLRSEFIVLANQYQTTTVVLPEGAMFLASSARSRGGLILVGSDHVAKRDTPNPKEGVLF